MRSVCLMRFPWCLQVSLFDALPYDEPHGWLMSPRQTLGALLTEQGEHARAKAIYVEDLTLFPANPWALAGLRICCSATADPLLPQVEAQLQKALEGADVCIGASCACALTDWRKDS